MSRRYSLARAKGREIYEQTYREDRQLLEQLGLGLLAVGGSLSVSFLSEIKGDKIHPWNRAEIDGKIWDQLRPFLEEVVALRAQNQEEGLRLAAK